MRMALVNRFSKVDDPQIATREATEARLLATDPSGSLRKLDRLYVKAELNEQTEYGILSAAVTKIQELPHFAIYRDARGYNRVKRGDEDSWSGDTAFGRQNNTGNNEGFAQKPLISTWNQRKKVLRRVDPYSSPLETEADALAKQLTELCSTIEKSQMESFQGSGRPHEGFLYFQKRGLGTNRCDLSPDRNSRFSGCKNNGCVLKKLLDSRSFYFWQHKINPSQVGVSGRA